MNRLSQEKKQKMIGIGGGSLAVCFLIWFFVIGSQQDKLEAVQGKVMEREGDLYKAETLAGRSARVEEQMAELRERLDEIEVTMVRPEALEDYFWLYKQLDDFIQERGYEVSISGVTAPELGRKFLMLPRFPYSAAAFGVELEGFFHDFGSFLADFENTFPYMSVQDLTMAPLATPSEREFGPTMSAQKMEPSRLEKLIIRMKIVTLYKPARGRN